MTTRLSLRWLFIVNFLQSTKPQAASQYTNSEECIDSVRWFCCASARLFAFFNAIRNAEKFLQPFLPRAMTKTRTTNGQINCSAQKWKQQSHAARPYIASKRWKTLQCVTCNAVHFCSVLFFVVLLIWAIYYENRWLCGKLLSLSDKFLVFRLLMSIIN